MDEKLTLVLYKYFCNYNFIIIPTSGYDKFVKYEKWNDNIKATVQELKNLSLCWYEDRQRNKNS